MLDYIPPPKQIEQIQPNAGYAFKIPVCSN